jgi:hypothetical protein
VKLGAKKSNVEPCVRAGELRKLFCLSQMVFARSDVPDLA